MGTYYGHPKKKCVCNEYQRTHYMSKISGPLLDRIDLQIEVQPVDFDQMSSKAPGEPSAAIRQRVIAARMLQERRFKDEPGIHCNAQMTPPCSTNTPNPTPPAWKNFATPWSA